MMVTWGLEGHYGLALLASSSVSGDPLGTASCHGFSRGFAKVRIEFQGFTQTENILFGI